MPKTNRKLRIGAVNLESGRMDIFTEDSENLKYGILGSCSVPGVFPTVPVVMHDGTKKTYVDGGVKTNYLADSGIQACFDAGYKQEDIIIDALMCYPIGLTSKPVADTMTTIDSFMLGSNIGSFHNAVSKLHTAMIQYPNVTFRNIIQPDNSIGPLPSAGLNFIPAEMEYMRQRGTNDTRIQIEKYPDGNAWIMMKQFLEQTADVVIQ